VKKNGRKKKCREPWEMKEQNGRGNGSRGRRKGVGWGGGKHREKRRKGDPVRLGDINFRGWGGARRKNGVAEVWPWGERGGACHTPYIPRKKSKKRKNALRASEEKLGGKMGGVGQQNKTRGGWETEEYRVGLREKRGQRKTRLERGLVTQGGGGVVKVLMLKI